MPIRQRIMTLNGNAGVGTVNAITKNLRKGNKLIKLNFDGGVEIAKEQICVIKKT